jgi:predicted small metal-binding protein
MTCDFVARGKTEEEIFEKAATHGKEVHGVELDEERKEMVRKVIKEE